MESFTRSVLMSDGGVRTLHQLERITHIGDGSTTVDVLSWADDTMTGAPMRTILSHELDDTMTMADAVAWVMTLDEFKEYIDPAREALNGLLPTLDDDQAELVPTAWPLWAVGVAYSVGDRVRVDDVLYRCVQAHTSQEGWEPAATPALWVRTTPEGTIPDWVQPTGAHDAYNAGDKVKHNEKVWTSLVDGNVWEPGAAGTESLWVEVISS